MIRNNLRSPGRGMFKRPQTPTFTHRGCQTNVGRTHEIHQPVKRNSFAQRVQKVPKDVPLDPKGIDLGFKATLFVSRQAGKVQIQICRTRSQGDGKPFKRQINAFARVQPVCIQNHRQINKVLPFRKQSLTHHASVDRWRIAQCPTGFQSVRYCNGVNRLRRGSDQMPADIIGIGDAQIGGHQRLLNSVPNRSPFDGHVDGQL